MSNTYDIMTAIPDSPPVILPVPCNTNRPLWSVMIPVYNCGHYLQETLESVLVQGIPAEEMQIEVVDDASTDIDVEALVNRIGNGQIMYFRQPQNVGSLRNFETCINRSRGHFLHLLHGDDKVHPGYYKKIEKLFDFYPEAGAAFCRFRCINEKGLTIYDKIPEMPSDGILKDWLLKIGERQLIQYAAITVRREVYEKLGAFYGITYGEDWEMWVRIARSYSVAYTPEIFAYYRTHSSSISSNKIFTGEHLQDLHTAMKLIRKQLPENKQKQIYRRSRTYYAAYGLNLAKELWNRMHDKQVVDKQIKEALNLSRSPRILMKSIKLRFYVSRVIRWS